MPVTTSRRRLPRHSTSRPRHPRRSSRRSRRPPPTTGTQRPALVTRPRPRPRPRRPTGRGRASRPSDTRLRLDVAYDGGPYSGWAAQPNRTTVQGALAGALSRVLGEDVRITVAWPDRRGVHATGQVCHSTCARSGSQRRFCCAGSTACWTPPCACWRSRRCPTRFDARFSALSRRYQYRVSDAPYGVLPLRRHDTLAHPRPLSLTRLRAGVGAAGRACTTSPRSAASARAPRRPACCAGSAGCASPTACSSRPSRPTRSATRWCARSSAPCCSSATAGATRSGRLAALRSAGPSSAGPVAPAHGLTLVEVRYPAPSRLAARTRATRQRREG